MNVQGAVESKQNNNNEFDTKTPTPHEAQLLELNEKIISQNDKLQINNKKLQRECSKLNAKVENLNEVVGPANVLAASDLLKRVHNTLSAIVNVKPDDKKVLKKKVLDMLPEIEAMQQNQILLVKRLEMLESSHTTKKEETESIHGDEKVLCENLELLQALEEIFCSVKKDSESVVLKNLKENEVDFNACIKEINTQHLAKVESYREGIENFINYLKEHEIKSSEHHSISQHLFFLDEQQVEKFHQSIPLDIKKFMTSSIEEVSEQCKTNKEWIKSFEGHHDSILKNLFEIEKSSHNIEWKISFYQYKAGLFKETTKLKADITQLMGKIAEISATLSHAKNHKGTVLAEAKKSKDEFIKRFNGFVDKAQELKARVEGEKTKLEDKILKQSSCTLKGMRDSLKFYDSEMEKEVKKMCDNFIAANKKEMELHFEALKLSLNLISYDLSKGAQKPSGMKRDSVRFKLQSLTSSIETNGGKSRGHFYNMKEAIGLNSTYGIKALDVLESNNNNNKEDNL